MSYQVFARKYRPKTFDDVLGQEHVVRTLRNAIAQHRLAHAYLFVGPRGTGKTSTARIFAKALNCPNGPSIDFDPEDEICREIAEGRSLDVLEIDGASNNGVDQVRELRESVKYAPAKSRFKIYYIDEVHMLSTAAFNALLKTLEEPPEHVKFIFATTEANKILPTIISRCQRFDLRRIPNTIIAKHLMYIAQLEGVDMEEKAAFAIGKGAEGGMRDAQSMMDQLVAFCGNTIRENDVLDIFGFTGVQTVSHLAQHILDSDTVGALKVVHEQSEAGKDLGRLLTDLIQHVRTLLVCQADPEAAGEDLEPEIAEQVQNQCRMASTEQLLRVVDGLADVDARMRWATNKRLHFELGVIQAVQHLNEVSISDVIEALDSGGALPPRPQAAARPAQTLSPRRAAAPAPAADSTPTVTAPALAPRVSSHPREELLPSVPPPAPIAREMEAAQPAESVATAGAEAPAPEPAAVAQPAAEPVPVPAAEPEPAPAPPPARTVAEPREFSPGEFWNEMMQRLQQRRPLVVSWADMATPLSIARGVVKLGFPTTEAHARDSLMRDNMRAFLEEMAADILGVKVKFDMVLDPALKPPPVTEMQFGFDEPAAKPLPKAEPRSSFMAPAAEAGPGKKAEPFKADSAPAPAAAPAAISPEDFLNDPLIKSAVEKFKLKIASPS